ncbi:hypothetical protein J3P96_04295 [Pseudomonas sp. R3-56]|uniref:hypothetical protein n=1 Tax=Pseudomonas sp. R3-56 TaxID=2817401 RepID=UPI003DA81753
MIKLKKLFTYLILMMPTYGVCASEPDDNETIKLITPKSLTIIFYPPAGREREFLDIFVKQQSEHMKQYTDKYPNPDGNMSINIAPTEAGEPLIHLIIYKSSENYKKAIATFSSREKLLSYINSHSSLYGGEQINPDFLKNSKIHFGEVISELPRSITP